MTSIDKILKQWADVRPDLNCVTMGTSGRLARVRNHWQKQIEVVLKAHGVSTIEFDILATMRRNQRPLTPTEIYRSTLLSSGAVSSKLEKLVQQGWVERSASDDDRRSNHVALTESGREFIDNVVTEHVANLDQLVSPLSDAEREQLDALLNKILARVN